MFIDADTIILAGGVLAAVLAFGGIFVKIHRWIIKQEEQSKQIEELKAQHEDDIAHIKKENTLICYGLSACLDGLQQLGCNHTVPKAKEMLDKHLNQQAHE